MKRTFALILVVGGAAVVTAAGVLLIVLRSFFFDLHYVPQNGMYPRIPARSYVVSVRRPYGTLSEVSRGDVVAYVPDQDGDRYLFIWRVIGLPGDRIAASEDRLEVNGLAVTRERGREEGPFTVFEEVLNGARYDVAIANVPEDIPPDVSVVVDADQLFVMGDNRYNAYDSRFTGAIPFSAVVGRVVWP